MQIYPLLLMYLLCCFLYYFPMQNVSYSTYNIDYQ